MPVLTFLRDALTSAKGRYDRHVGRHTRTFCKRAERYAKTPVQRRIWLSSAISADEVIASMAGLDKRRPLGALAGWQLSPKAGRSSYPKALRGYLSALLLLYGTCKEDLLSKLGLTEGEFMQAWQMVFQYDAADNAIFDEDLAPAFRERGIDGLVTATGELIRETLFRPESPFGKQEQSDLQALMVDDLAALKRHLAKKEEEPAAPSPSPSRKGAST
jgi:hypothetical protein